MVIYCSSAQDRSHLQVYPISSIRDVSRDNLSDSHVSTPNSHIMFAGEMIGRPDQINSLREDRADDVPLSVTHSCA